MGEISNAKKIQQNPNAKYARKAEDFSNCLLDGMICFAQSIKGP